MTKRNPDEEVMEDGDPDKPQPPRHKFLFRWKHGEFIVTNWGLVPFVLLIVVVTAVVFWAPDLLAALPWLSRTA